MASHEKGRTAPYALIGSFTRAICSEIKLNRPQSTVWSPLFAGCFIEVPWESESWLRRGGTPRNKAAAETASDAVSFLIFLDHFESLLARISFGQK